MSVGVEIRDPKTPFDQFVALGRFMARSSARDHVAAIQFEEGGTWHDVTELCFELRFRGDILVNEIFDGAAKLLAGQAEIELWDRRQAADAMKTNHASWFGKIKRANLDRRARIVWVVNRERYDAAKKAFVESQGARE